jgi:dolichyl-phosphate-mannose--protein O-mannosyl transferase
LPRLGFPVEAYFDEVYHAKSAYEYLQGQPPTDWVHPPTAKLLIAIPIWLFGYESWAWRLAPALAGIALAPVFYALARRATGSERAAVIASALLLADGVYLVQSRIAMTNIFGVLFQITAVLFVLRAAREERLRTWDMLVAGLALGLALSSRWTSLCTAALVGFVLLGLRRERLLRPREIVLVGTTGLIVPLAVYVLSYLPWMAQRADVSTAAGLTAGLASLWPEQYQMWRYHTDLRASHPYFSHWATWPWLIRPTWYYFEQSQTKVYGIFAAGNPFVWWASIPATIWAFTATFKRREPQHLLAAFGFCAMYLPWAISPRTLNYGHYLFEAIPYACLAIALWLDEHWDTRLGRACRAYVTIVAATFLFFFPLYTALPVPRTWYSPGIAGVRLWTWLPGWS